MPAYYDRIKTKAGRWITGRASNGATVLNDATSKKVLKSAAKRGEPGYRVLVNSGTVVTVSHETELRNLIIREAKWGVAKRAQIHYPAGDIRTQGLPSRGHLPQTIDCSQAVTWWYRLAGAPDPNGSAYKAGSVLYTGTLLGHCKHIDHKNAKLADMIVYGGGTGLHVVLVAGPWKGLDTVVISHGQEAGPILTTHGKELEAHGGSACPVTVLTLPSWS